MLAKPPVQDKVTSRVYGLVAKLYLHSSTVMRVFYSLLLSKIEKEIDR